MASWIEYSVTRPFTIRYFATVFIVVGVIWTTLIMCLAVAAVGYELNPVNSDSYNVSRHLWYERIFPERGWFPVGRRCEGSIIKAADCKPNASWLIEVLMSTGIFFYLFGGFLDVTTDGPIDGMIYRDYPLQHCSIQTIGIVQ